MLASSQRLQLLGCNVLYITEYGEMVDLSKSNKRIKIIGKVDQQRV